MSSKKNGAAPTLLFVTNVAWFFISHRLPLACAAINRGWNVHVASDVETEAEIAELRNTGVQFHRLHMIRGGLNPAREIACLWQLGRIIRHVRPDILHNVTPKPVIYGSWFARLLGIPGVVNAISGFGHVYATEARLMLLRRLLDRAYAFALSPPNVRVVVQNDEDRAEVLRLCARAAENTRLIRGSGVDLEVFGRTEETQGEPMVLLPARMLREKGVLEFAAAARQLRSAGVAARFVLAGRVDTANPGGLSAAELGKLCASTGVEWVGDVRDMPWLYRESHVVCLPSYYREGVPKVLLEACASGRPIVTTDTPGCRDVVAARNGLLVPPRNSSALAAAIHQLLIDPDQRKRMGEEGRRLAEREFGIRRVIEKHFKIYSELLALSARAR
jgi:glycosyltransferase involved in cell wall biosynthesis